jgi:hypothetical protein
MTTRPICHEPKGNFSNTFDFTCLTKALVLVNEVQETSKTTLADGGDEYLQHKMSASYLFSYMARELNVKDLKSRAKEIKAMYIERLSTEFIHLLDYPRILDSLYHAATILLIGNLPWLVDTVKFSEVLKSYTLERCLPNLIMRIEQEKKRENSMFGQSDVVEDPKSLARAIVALSTKEFFCNVAFTNVKNIPGICLAKTWDTDNDCDLNSQSYKEMLSSAPITKSAFSKIGTDSIYRSKRHNKEDTGDFSRRDAFTFKATDLQAVVYNAIVTQLKKVLKDVEITKSTNIQSFLDKHYNSDQHDDQPLEVIVESQEEREI